jgi:hypothetical protein
MGHIASGNPLAGQNQQPTYAGVVCEWAIDPALTAAILVGMLVEFEATTIVPAGDGAYTPVYVQPSSTTADALIAGVMIGSPSVGTASAIPNSIAGGASQVAMVLSYGVTQVLCDNTTTVGHTLIASTGTAGIAHDAGASTGTAARTIGTALQAVTISSGTALVWAKINVL